MAGRKLITSTTQTTTPSMKGASMQVIVNLAPGGLPDTYGLVGKNSSVREALVASVHLRACTEESTNPPSP